MEINPKWTHAIDINVCPFCGNGIMEENLKNLFSSLRVIMAQFTDYSVQLDDWLLSNYNYIKTNSLDLVKYIPEEYIKTISSQKINVSEVIPNKKSIIKVDVGDKTEEVIVEKIQPEEITNSFQQRAEVIKPRIDGFTSIAEKTQHLKALAQQIKKEGLHNAPKTNMANLMASELDGEVNEYSSTLGENGDDIQSSLADSNSMDDEIPAFVLAMANQGKNNSSTNNADLQKLRMQQLKQNESRKNFQNGAKGSFHRA